MPVGSEANAIKVLEPFSVQLPNLTCAFYWLCSST